MKSNKQRRLEIKAKRRKHSETLKAHYSASFNCVDADPHQLSHNHEYAFLPTLYVDQPFSCRDCGAAEVWTAKSQKWWYEIAKGYLHSTAVRCRECRSKIKTEKEQQKLRMTEAAKLEPHPNDAFFRKRY